MQLIILNKYSYNCSLKNLISSTKCQFLNPPQLTLKMSQILEATKKNFPDKFFSNYFATAFKFRFATWWILLQFFPLLKFCICILLLLLWLLAWHLIKRKRDELLAKERERRGELSKNIVNLCIIWGFFFAKQQQREKQQQHQQQQHHGCST